jgi:hypothetical protein
VNALPNPCNIFPLNAAGERREAIRRPASDRERQALLKGKIRCGSEG